jgi:hypothetical protein
MSNDSEIFSLNIIGFNGEFNDIAIREPQEVAKATQINNRDMKSLNHNDFQNEWERMEVQTMNQDFECAQIEILPLQSKVELAEESQSGGSHQLSLNMDIFAGCNVEV